MQMTGWDSTNPSCPMGGGRLYSNNMYGPGYYEATIQPGRYWASFWINGTSNSDCDPGLIAGFEADICENLRSGGQNNTDWGGCGSCHQSAGCFNLGANIDTFHIVGLWWGATADLKYYLEGVQTCSLAGPVTSGAVNRLILTIESGGAGGDPFLIKWVRYYQAS